LLGIKINELHLKKENKMTDVIDVEAVEVKDKPVMNLLQGYTLKKDVYREYAVREFKAAGLVEESGEYCSPEQETICEAILKMADAMATTDRSDGAIDYILKAANRIGLFSPMTPITGDDSEWEVVEGHPEVAAINIRLPRLAKLHNGDTMFSSALGFRDRNGNTYEGMAQTESGDIIASAQRIKGYPFTPIMAALDVEFGVRDEDNNLTIVDTPTEESILIISDMEQLEEIKKHYDIKPLGNINDIEGSHEKPEPV
jgi:hypothetical protein